MITRYIRDGEQASEYRVEEYDEYGNMTHESEHWNGNITYGYDYTYQAIEVPIPETEAPTEPDPDASEESMAADGETNVPISEDSTTNTSATVSDTKGCASVMGLSAAALLPLCWLALRKKTKQ